MADRKLVGGVAAAASVAALAAWAIKKRSEGDWEAAIDRVSRGVVVVRVSSVKAFDMNDAGFSYATGFVVDAKLGIIMTNRHVVTTGPVTADAVLFNKEEVDLQPIYSDPVHDFGFFRYEPSAVKYMVLEQIALAPKAARVGLDVRVVGNDAGEKISILSGTLARLDRAAPHYGSGSFNDFNTFYYSCASNTSGGSSGSPVINARGEAIALNAGTSTKSASSYYLPLERPARALALLQAALRAPETYCGARASIPRGDLCVIFVHKAFGELRRLGLQDETEAAVRRALRKETGMLVVEQVVPGGPSFGKLHPGDVLLRLRALRPCEVDEQAAEIEEKAASGSSSSFCTTFLELEGLLDSSVGEQVLVTVQRGGKVLTVAMKVSDLHSLSPTSLLEVGGCTMHALSYQQARNWNLPPGSVHTAYAGYMLSNAGVPSRAIVRELNSTPTPTLDAFLTELQKLPDRARVPLRYAQPFSQHQERLVVITVDRTWFSCVSYTRDDLTGQWHAHKCQPPPPAPEPVPQTVTFALAGPPPVQTVSPALVRVLFDIPYQIDGVASLKYIGAGLVVDASLGLVLVDRNTIPVVPGDVRVEFASTVEVAAVVRFLHPTHNFGLVQYDPKHIKGNEVVSATLSTTPIEVGEECTFVGLSRIDTGALPVFQPCVVRETCMLDAGMPSIPRYRAINEEVVRFDLGMALEDTIGGVFVDDVGEVKAVWAAYATCTHDEELYEQFEGMPIGAAIPLIDALAAGSHIAEAAPPNEGSGLGLTREWAVRLSNADVEKRQALLVQRLSPRVKAKGSSAAATANGTNGVAAAAGGGGGGEKKEEKEEEVDNKKGGAGMAALAEAIAKDGADELHEGDLLLAVDGVPVATFPAVEECVLRKPSACVTLLRDGLERSLTTSLAPVSSDGTVHIVMWCGLVVQEAYRSVLERGFEPKEGGVYISYYLFGSPAHKHKLVPKNWIIQLNDEVVPDIPGFVRLIQRLKHGESCRVKTCDLTGRVSAFTLKTDHWYWRSYEVARERGEWVQRVIPEPS